MVKKGLLWIIKDTPCPQEIPRVSEALWQKLRPNTFVPQSVEERDFNGGIWLVRPACDPHDFPCLSLASLQLTLLKADPDILGIRRQVKGQPWGPTADILWYIVKGSRMEMWRVDVHMARATRHSTLGCLLPKATQPRTRGAQWRLKSSLVQHCLVWEWRSLSLFPSELPFGLAVSCLWLNNGYKDGN